jgi:septum formation protein
MMQSPWIPALPVPLVLASASPRRTWILSEMGIPHSVDPANIDESQEDESDPAALVLVLAAKKAMETSRRHPGSLVLGADTIVYLSPYVLGKPGDPEHAKEMLSKLSGKEHIVWTGIHLAMDGIALTGRAVPAAVKFRQLTSLEIDTYVATGDPLDKAGSYGIQGAGLGMVESLNGCFYSVAGLPVAATIELLRDWLSKPNHGLTQA